MKKLISAFLTVLMVVSLATAVYADDENGNGKGKGKKQEKFITSTEAPEIAPFSGPADTLEGLLEQLKSYHKGKAIRKQLHNRIKEVRKQKGDNTIPVIVNGELVKFDVPPVIKHNRTLIPVRAVTNALGASVEWDRETNDVTVTKAVYSNIDISIQTSTIKVVIDLDTGKYYKDGVEVDFDVPAQVISNRTVVPIRFLAEIFGMKVDWDKDLDGVVVDDEEKVTYPTPPETTVTPTPSPNPTP
jgi:hypothetical protein